MSNVEIIEEVYRSEEFEELLSKITSDSQYKDDLKQEVVLILLELDPQKIIDLHEKEELKWFIVRIVKNQYHSNKSPFYRKHRKLLENSSPIFDIPNEEYDYDTEDMIKFVLKEKNSIHKRPSMLEWLFIEGLLEAGGNKSKMARVTGISRHTIMKYVKQLKYKTQLKWNSREQ